MSFSDKIDLKPTIESRHYDIDVTASGDKTTTITENNFKEDDNKYKAYKTIIDKESVCSYRKDGSLIQCLPISNENKALNEDLKKAKKEQKYKIDKMQPFPVAQIRKMKEDGFDVEIQGKGKVKISKNNTITEYSPSSNRISQVVLDGNKALKYRRVKTYKMEDDGQLALSQVINEDFAPTAKGQKRWCIESKQITNLRVSDAKVKTRAEKVSTTQSNIIVAIFPNPAQNELFMEIPTDDKETPVNISIVDVAGKVVMHMTERFSPVKANIKDLQNGVYVIRVEAPNQAAQTIRFVKN